jgi:RHS repeat-associated protein
MWEWRITQVDSGGTASYVYNENGRRVRKNTGSTFTEYYYGPNGSVQGEWNGISWPAEYVYAGNRLIAEYESGTTEFIHADHLGSTRLVTGVTGSNLCSLDYYPFGATSSGCTSTTHKFTGKERDAESGNDYFGRRYFGSSVGRFISPDSIANDWELGNPQTWNRYAYARNNPLIYTDPDGAAVELLCTGNFCHAQLEEELKTLQAAVGNKEAASRLYINAVKDGDNTRYFVGIKGDVGDFMKLGDTSHDLANVVQDKQVIEFGVTKQNLEHWGGAVTYDKGDVGNQNVRVLVNPDQAGIATSRLSGNTVLGAIRFAGYDQSPPWRVRPMTPGIMTWHEFGHAGN